MFNKNSQTVQLSAGEDSQHGPEVCNQGRVEVNVSALGEKSEAKEVRVDKDLALAYYNALKELSNYLQLDLEVDIKAIADFPDVFLVEEKEPDQENSQRALEIALTAALEDLVAMRAAEGKNYRRT